MNPEEVPTSPPLAHPRLSARAVAVAGAGALVTALGALLFALANVTDAPAVSAQNEGLDWAFPVEVAPAEVNPASLALHIDVAAREYAAWAGNGVSPDQPAIWLRSRDAAGVWSEPELVMSDTQGVVTAIDLVTDARGFLHTVWAGSTGADADIYHSVRGKNGGWSAPRVVNDDNGRFAQDAPRIEADLWGNVHVVWVDHRLSSADVYHARIGGDGRPGANLRVHGAPAGDQSEPALALTSGGDLHAAWTDTGGGQAVVKSALIPHSGLDPELPDRELVWWPAAKLSSGSNRQGSPVLIPGTHQVLTAAWVDGTHGVRAARLTTASPYWQADRTVYTTNDFAVGRLSGAGDLAGRTYLAWEENDDAGGRRLMAGSLPDEGSLNAVRADYSPITSQGARPDMAVTGASALTLAWLSDGLDGERALFVRDAPLAAAAFPAAVHEGWLVYIPGRMSCPLDGYLIATCDGATGPFVTGVVDPRFIGRWVRAEGVLVEGVRCPQLLASRMVLATSPCPRREGAVTGVIRAGGAPVEGATVHLGEQTATTGASGRFFVGQLPGGQHVVTATALCALVATETVNIQSEFTTVTSDAELVRADAQEDCVVDLMDLVRVTLAYHAAPPFHPRCADLNADAIVDVRDVAAVASAYDAVCPTAWRAGSAEPDSRAPNAGPGRSQRHSTGKGAGAYVVYRGPGWPVAWAVHFENRANGDAPYGWCIERLLATDSGHDGPHGETAEGSAA